MPSLPSFVPGGSGPPFASIFKREIWEIATIGVCPNEIPGLLLLPEDVAAWKEAKKYAAVLRSGVRYLCCDEIEDPQNILRNCSELVDLFFIPPKDTFPGTFIDQINSLHNLRRLSTVLGALLDAPDTLKKAVFSNITHLTLFDNVEGAQGSWKRWKGLALLPSLTHLCLNEIVAPSLLHGALRNCKTLEILLNQVRFFEMVQPHTYCKDVGVTDQRYVMLKTSERVYEWELGAGGARGNMWARAAAFIAAKKRNEKPKLQFWVDDNAYQYDEPDHYCAPSPSGYGSDSLDDEIRDARR
ncbi:hypothetical protein B0H15DRAFT_834426 [Mycena belliarum]|uniref:Uncharacterized protein n=1 Tax=Mycena belliarum TaxID=1033014 RepID=A0AAD6UBB3_9AGAR|nr:hypothetical protein B0H15DRAFT_834426 [Mycena belliae]